MILQVLHIILHLLLGLAELIASGVALVYTFFQVLIGICRIKCTSFLTGVRLVPTRRLPFIIAEYKIALGVAMASGLLLLTLSGVRIAFLTINPRYQLTVRVSLIGTFSLLLLGGGLLVFLSHSLPVFPGLQGVKKTNPLFGRYSEIVTTIFSLNIFLHHCWMVILDFLADNVIPVKHIYGIL